MPKEVVTTLKTYCESGMFARGKDALSGMASIALFGNTNQPVEVMVRSSHLFLPMPDVIREDMAFLDRLHFYLPGWEIPKMRVEFFTDHYGFVVDYLAEALRELRKHNYTELMDRSLDPLAPGSVYTASVDDQGKVGLYRLEVALHRARASSELPGASQVR